MDIINGAKIMLTVSIRDITPEDLPSCAWSGSVTHLARAAGALDRAVQGGDAVLDEHLATVCRIKDGRIASIETYLSDVDGMNAFFVPA
jgi:hypothetical protein